MVSEILPFELSNSKLEPTTISRIQEIINANHAENLTYLNYGKYLPAAALGSIFPRKTIVTYLTQDNNKLVYYYSDETKISFYIVAAKIYEEADVIVEKANSSINLNLHTGELTICDLGENSVVIKTSITLAKKELQLDETLHFDDIDILNTMTAEPSSDEEDSELERVTSYETDSEEGELEATSDYETYSQGDEDDSYNFTSLSMADIFKNASSPKLQNFNDEYSNSSDSDELDYEDLDEFHPAPQALREFICLSLLEPEAFFTIAERPLAKHPEIVEFTSQLVMPYLPGITLETYLKKRHSQNNPIGLDVIDIMINITMALGKLHRAGIVAGDLRPSNIMQTKKNGHYEFTIFDFDGSAIINNDIFEPELNVFREIVTYTVHFMPPEGYTFSTKLQKYVLGNIIGTTEYDIYSLGVIFFLLLGLGHDDRGLKEVLLNTLRTHPKDAGPDLRSSNKENKSGNPFAEKTYFIDANLFANITPELKLVINELISLLRKMLENNPEKRYKNTDEIIKYLVSIKELALRHIKSDTVEVLENKKVTRFFESPEAARSMPNMQANPRGHKRTASFHSISSPDLNKEKFKRKALAWEDIRTTYSTKDVFFNQYDANTLKDGLNTPGLPRLPIFSRV